jgi:hypothetical protein
VPWAFLAGAAVVDDPEAWLCRVAVNILRSRSRRIAAGRQATDSVLATASGRRWYGPCRFPKGAPTRVASTAVLRPHFLTREQRQGSRRG